MTQTENALPSSILLSFLQTTTNAPLERRRPLDSGRWRSERLLSVFKPTTKTGGPVGYRPDWHRVSTPTPRCGCTDWSIAVAEAPWCGGGTASSGLVSLIRQPLAC